MLLSLSENSIRRIFKGRLPFFRVRRCVKAFAYHSLLDEKVKLLVHEVTKKNEALSSTQELLSMIEVALTKASLTLDLSLKKVE